MELGLLGGVLGRFSSNIFTREVVGGIGVSSVVRKPSTVFRCRIVRFDSPPTLVFLFKCSFQSWSTLSRVVLTLGFCHGNVSRSAACGSGQTAAEVTSGLGLIGLNLAAANFAAMFEGEEVRSTDSEGTSSTLEALDLFEWRNGERFP